MLGAYHLLARIFCTVVNVKCGLRFCQEPEVGVCRRFQGRKSQAPGYNEPSAVGSPQPTAYFLLLTGFTLSSYHRVIVSHDLCQSES